MDDLTYGLIQEVKNRPILWNNRTCPEYGNKTLTLIEWEEIATVLNSDPTTLKTKWKYLRSHFKRVSKRKGMPLKINGNKWGPYDSLVFLNEVIEHDPDELAAAEIEVLQYQIKGGQIGAAEAAKREIAAKEIASRGGITGQTIIMSRQQGSIEKEIAAAEAAAREVAKKEMAARDAVSREFAERQAAVAEAAAREIAAADAVAKDLAIKEASAREAVIRQAAFKEVAAIHAAARQAAALAAARGASSTTIEAADDYVYSEENLLNIEHCNATVTSSSNIDSAYKKVLSKSNKPPEEDHDLYFIKSLLPFYKSLTALRKLRVMGQFQNILINEHLEMERRRAEYLKYNAKKSNRASMATKRNNKKVVRIFRKKKRVIASE